MLDIVLRNRTRRHITEHQNYCYMRLVRESLKSNSKLGEKNTSSAAASTRCHRITWPVIRWRHLSDGVGHCDVTLSLCPLSHAMRCSLTSTCCSTTRPPRWFWYFISLSARALCSSERVSKNLWNPRSAASSRSKYADCRLLWQCTTHQ